MQNWVFAKRKFSSQVNKTVCILANSIGGCRVNELCTESEDMKAELGLTEGPLVEWWAVLPPPLDVVVGLRQVHFLSEYWRVKRGYEKQDDVIAETLFPFISLPEKFTLKQFFRRPKHWFWFTKEWKDFEFEFLKD